MARGEFDTVIDIASHTQALSMERKNHQDLLNLLAGLTPLFQQLYEGQAPNIAEITRRMLERGYDEQMIDEILPMLQQQKNAPLTLTQPGGAPDAGGLGGPQNAGAEALQAGRGVGNNIAPAKPDMFNEEAPSTGRMQGRTQTP